MTTITTAASTAALASVTPNAINTFIQTLQGNPFGALCFLLVCVLIYRYLERAEDRRKGKRKRRG